MKRRDFLVGSIAGAGALVAGAARAQTRPCPPPTFGVQGGSSLTNGCTEGTLSALARTMTAGTWAAMPQPVNWDRALYVGSVTGHMLPYMDYMPWNPVAKVVEIIGQDHNGSSCRHVRYDPATNALSVVSAGVISTALTNHGYNSTCVAPNGDVFYRHYGYGNNQQIYRLPAGQTTAWVKPYATHNTFQQQTGAYSFWPAGLSGVGAGGAIVGFNQQGNGEINTWDVTSRTWLSTVTNATGANTEGLHGISAYNAVSNIMVYGGGDSIGRQIYRLNASRTVTRLADLPTTAQMGVRDGWLAPEPNGPGFLLFCPGRLFYVDGRGSGTYTELTGSRVPPAGITRPGAADGWGFITTFFDDGVIGVFSTTDNRLWLYKHA